MADKNKNENRKIVLDPIYGMIELDPLAVKIIDTHYFQRLRYIKQLSFADFVYPGATHTRFAHSIGVYHLACEMIKRIKSQELSKAARLTKKEETCIRVAALCHDIGHGPFSHAYEHIFKEDLQGVKHEDISQVLVDKMFKDKEYRLPQSKVDINLIQALIQGNYEDYIHKKPEMKAKKYLFQIVSNETSGMDVDKWDYFNRDAIACGVSERFQFDRALQVVGVVKVDGVYQLGYRKHDAFSFYNMYNTRFTLYRTVYRHRVVVAVELMVEDVFKSVREANKTLEESDKGESENRLTIKLFPATDLQNGKQQEQHMLLRSKDKDGSQLASKVKTNSAKSDKGDGSKPQPKYLMIEDYLKLRDDVLLKIQDSKCPEYKNARNLIERLHTRKLYKFITEFKVNADTTDKEVDEIKDYLQKEIAGHQRLKEAVKIKVETFNYGKKADDPVEQMYFYGKGETENPKKLERKEVSFVLPSIFQEHYVSVYETFSGNTDYTKEKKSQLKTDFNEVLQNFKKKYQDKLVMSRKPDAFHGEMNRKRKRSSQVKQKESKVKRNRSGK